MVKDKPCKGWGWRHCRESLRQKICCCHLGQNLISCHLDQNLGQIKLKFTAGMEKHADAAVLFFPTNKKAKEALTNKKGTSRLLADRGSKQVKQEQALHSADPSQHPDHLHLRLPSYWNALKIISFQYFFHFFFTFCHFCGGCHLILGQSGETEPQCGQPGIS